MNGMAWMDEWVDDGWVAEVETFLPPVQPTATSCLL